MTGPALGGAMEAERRRVFDDAQREADTMFAQYQLSQLLASGDALEDMAGAVLVEIARASRAGGAALWLAEPGRVELALVAVTGPGDLDAGTAGNGTQPPPPSFADVAAAVSWAVAGGWSGVQLEESRDIGQRVERAAVGFVAVRPAAGAALDPDHVRYLALVRRELAITFRAAQLRSSLARDRAMLEAILDGASDAIVAVDAERRVVQLNVAAAHLLGVPAREAIGAPCHEVLDCGPFSVPGDPGAPDPVDDTPPWALRCGLVCPFGEVLESGHPITAREQTMHHRDGTQVPVSASFAPTAGPAVGAVAVMRDLRPLRALDELKSSFVAAVSHELRTPLALISGYAQSLLHLDLDPEASRRQLVRIRESVERLTELVDQILDISNLESDRLTIHLGPVSVDELLGSFAAEMADLPASPPIELSIAPGLPLVEADPLRMRQVLTNLTTNTMKYAGRGASIRVRARRLDRSTVAVTVADDGVGIDPSERDQVFERFYRGRDVRESRTAGSGLGLYLCRRLIEAQGGWIRLDATTRGTSVSLGLPIASARADVEEDGDGATGVGRVGRIIRAVRR